MVNGNRVVGRAQGREIAGPDPVIHRRFDKARDRPELDVPSDERGHRNLIGGVEYRSRTATGAQGIIGQPQSREPREIRRLEGELADLGEIELRRRADDSVRPSEAMRNRDAHVRCAKLGDHRTIGEFDHAVDDRLRMHQDVDFVRREREQVGRLDDFEALVHHRSRNRS